MMFCTCIGIFINQLVLCINKYLKNESSIEVLMERYSTPKKSFLYLIQLVTKIHDFSTQWAEIPTLSICPSFDSAFKRTVLNETFGLLPDNVRNFSFPPQVQSVQFYEKVTHSITDLIQQITIKTKEHYPGHDSLYIDLKFNDSGIVFPDTLEIKPERWFKKMAWHKFGYCFSFEMPPEIKKLNVRSYKICRVQRYI